MRLGNARAAKMSATTTGMGEVPEEGTMTCALMEKRSRWRKLASVDVRE